MDAKIEQADGVVSIPPLPEIDLGARAVVCLKHAGKVYGYLWVQAAFHDLTDEQRRRIEEVAKEAAQILHEQMGKRYKRQEEVHDLFLRFIQYRDMSERDVQMELQLLGVTFPSRFAVVVFYVENDRRKDDIRQYMTWMTKATHAPIFLFITIIRFAYCWENTDATSDRYSEHDDHKITTRFSLSNRSRCSRWHWQ